MDNYINRFYQMNNFHNRCKFRMDPPLENLTLKFRFQISENLVFLKKVFCKIDHFFSSHLSREHSSLHVVLRQETRVVRQRIRTPKIHFLQRVKAHWTRSNQFHTYTTTGRKHVF